MCNNYAKFIPQYTYIYIYLHCFTIYSWKTQKFDKNLTIDCSIAFKPLKHALVHAPVLAIPNFDTDFVVETNASDAAVSAVLMQNNPLVTFILKVHNSAQ